MAGFSTRAIRAASRGPRFAQVPTTVPIYQTATFATEDFDELADVLADATPGFAYSRTDNPTGSALADAFAEIHGAGAGYAFASGMAAIHAVLLSLVSAGERIVASNALYGSTRALLGGLFGRLGIEVAFVDPADHAAIAAALDARPTRALYVETIANPTIVVADLAALADLAHGRGATFVVDNTFASPAVCRPIEHGADLVVESATKWLGGHSDVIAGVAAGNPDRIAAVRRVQIDTGGTINPFAAFLVLRGLMTLDVRTARHAQTASTLAGWLEGRPGVARVVHPSLASHPQAAVAARQLDRPGGMLAFELAGGRAAGRAFIDALAVSERTASLGSVHTMVVHPASTSHRQLTDAALAGAGIAPGLLRCSVGLEDAEDLRADMERALAVATGARTAAPADALAARA